jgi:hypothetical protein
MGEVGGEGVRVGVGAGVGASFLESMGRNVIVCVQIYQKAKEDKDFKKEIDSHSSREIRKVV